MSKRMKPLRGIDISGVITAKDDHDLTFDDVRDFMDALIEMVEVRGWEFGGGASIIDANAPCSEGG